MTPDHIVQGLLTCRRETCETQRILSIVCASFAEAPTCLAHEYCQEDIEPWDSIQLTPVEVRVEVRDGDA